MGNLSFLIGKERGGQVREQWCEELIFLEWQNCNWRELADASLVRAVVRELEVC